MGGIVIKRAFIIAKQRKYFESIAQRTAAVIFLATPHRGSDLAKVLSKILSLSGGPRPFLNDLHRNSLATQSTNEEFSGYSQELKLFSFYETIETNLGLSKALIVDKDSATLGLFNERTVLLNANHRNVCKFNSQEDSNYQTLRNSLASLINAISTRTRSCEQETNIEKQRLLGELLGNFGSPEDDLRNADNLRLSGSCEWLTKKRSFQQWRDSNDSQLYWISAKPATGKTVLSGKIISHLKDLNRACAFHFFVRGHKTNSNVAAFLLSVAWQMACADASILKTILERFHEEDRISNSDHLTIWRKIFLEGIFKVKLNRPHFWVLDALDECCNASALVPILIKASENFTIRIILTCRDRYEQHKPMGLLRDPIVSDTISLADTESDIALYLKANLSQIPARNQEDRQKMTETILAKSAGCFLWVTLILQNLRQVHTSHEIHNVLETVPSDMNELYAHIVQKMSQQLYGKDLARAILTWTLCSGRPLTTEELFHALQIDLRDTIDSIRGSIESSCGQLIYIDDDSRVRMVHETARGFFLSENVISEFAIESREGHQRLATTCLEYLSGKEMRGLRHGKLRATDAVTQRSPFLDYAARFLFEHVAHISPTDDAFVSMLARFMCSSNILSWIEYLSRCSDLNCLIHAGKVLERFVQRRAENQSPYEQKEAILLRSWSTDLVRLVTKFGKNLIAHPSSISNLIPPFCPYESAPWKHFAASARGIAVLGLSGSGWDDCIATFMSPSGLFSALACTFGYFALGTKDGAISICDATTCQETNQISHGELVLILLFSNGADFLISCGSKTIIIWELPKAKEICRFTLPQQCIALKLTEDNRLLFGALKDNHVAIWDLTEGCLRDSIDWTVDFSGDRVQSTRPPIAADFCINRGLLAILYRGLDILLWDLDRDSLYATYNKDTGASPLLGRRGCDVGAITIKFGQEDTAGLLAAAYADGDLVLFDTSDGTVKTTIAINAHVLACSPNGTILASGDGSGKVQLFDFETLKLLYAIETFQYGIKQLEFSADQQHLLNIRGIYCKVWDPLVLLRQEDVKNRSDTISTVAESKEFRIESRMHENLITSIACHRSQDFAFYGKQDGGIYLLGIRSGKQDQRLTGHGAGTSITKLVFDESSLILSSVDNSSHVVSRILGCDKAGWHASEVLFECRVGIAVDQVLCNSGHTFLLVSSAKSDMLWSLSPTKNRLVSTISRKNRGSYRWATHPVSEHQLILVSDGRVHLYDWHTLQSLTTTEGIILQGNIIPEMAINSICPCFGGTIIITTFRGTARLRPKSKLLLWNTADFSPEQKEAVPVPQYHHLSDHVLALIGAKGQKLVFLHVNGWVCSADPRTTSADQYVRHFFFPADWLTTDQGLIIKMTDRGDIVFVKRDEVAVIRRGLENIEPGPDGSLSKRPSLRNASLQVPS